MVSPWVMNLAPGLAFTLAISLAPACRKPARREVPPGRVGVTVQSLGAAPRVRLRYRFQPNEVLHYRMTSRRQISDLPRLSGPVVVALSVRTERVSRRRAWLRWRVEQVLQGGAQLMGRSLWVETSTRGALASVTSRRPEPADPRLTESVKQLYVAWPAEALGPGARWTQRRDLILAASTKGGVRTRLVARYLFDRTAPCGQGRCAHVSVITKVDISHRAGRVKVWGKGSGTGQVVFDLDRGHLVKSRTRADIGLSTSVSAGEVVQRISLDQTLEQTR